MKPATEPLTVRAPEVARMLGLHPRTVLRNRRLLPPAIRAGRAFLWNREEILAFMRAKPAAN